VAWRVRASEGKVFWKECGWKFMKIQQNTRTLITLLLYLCQKPSETYKVDNRVYRIIACGWITSTVENAEIPASFFSSPAAPLLFNESMPRRRRRWRRRRRPRVRCNSILGPGTLFSLKRRNAGGRTAIADSWYGEELNSGNLALWCRIKLIQLDNQRECPRQDPLECTGSSQNSTITVSILIKADKAWNRFRD